LREAEARYRTMVDNAMEGIFRTSLDGRFVRANPAMARMLGYAGVEELKASVRDLARQMYVDPEDRAVLIRRLLDQGAVQFFEVQARRSDGETFWVEISCRLVADDAGQPRWIDGFATDVSERKARLEAQRELKAAEAASLSKSLFLANMSHEIRTPMNIILGATDMLGSSALTSDQRGYVRLLRESCDNLLSLISDVLDLSKIEAGKIELQERDFDLHRLLGQVLDIFSVQAADKGLDLSARISPELPATLRGDPNRLRQILNNLLGNAVKFTSEGEVVLEASLANAPCEKTDAFEVLFMVRDTGPGVPPERSSSIFEAFTQAPDATGRDYGGVGLGLAITRSLVEIMGGSVWCESRPGQGSAFWAAVPFRAAEGVPEEAESQPVLPESLAPASVLMVEDNDLNRLLFEYYLEDTPCAVTFASDGREGVEAFRNGRFDIVFMDVSMPVMDGLAATRAIREIERERGADPVTVVALTAHALAGDEERCRQAGCSLYLVKPVRRRDVLRHIQDCVGPPGAAAGGD
ncbi:MAG: ATP-binding protein, partial [Desulfovibrionaceae bacterium]